MSTMKPFSHTRVLPALALCFLPVLCAQAANAQAARSVYLFNSSFGQGPGVAQDARTGPWGNGSSQTARRIDYEGAPSLQITTRSFVEGVRFDLTRPIDPAPYMNNGFLRMRLKFRETGGGAGGGDTRGGGDLRGGGDSRGGGGDSRGGGRGMGNPEFRGQGELVPRWDGAAQIGRRGDGALPGFGGDPRMGGRGGDMGEMGGDMGALAGPPPQTTYIKELKITFLRDQGAMTGRLKVNLRSDDNQPDDNGWRLFTLALKDMTSTPGASGAVRRVILTSDTEDIFYMAQMALVVETGQMTASIRTSDKPAGAQIAEIEWKPGTPLRLVADVEAGAADPQVEWNFDADNVGNLPPAAVSGAGALNPDGTPAGGAGMGGDPRMGGMMGGGDPRGGGRDPRGQLGIGGGGGRDGRRGGDGRTGGMTGGGMTGGEGGQPLDLGPRIDARGLTATFTYPNEEQNYRVEVTVRDRSGQKQPVKASVLVRVRG